VNASKKTFHYSDLDYGSAKSGCLLLRDLAVGLSLLISGSVHAQNVTPVYESSVQNEGARVIYNEAYFSEFNALTVEDLLNRVPGIQDILRDAQSQTSASATARRGFGSTGDQILIDGRRLSGKSNTVASALQRIQASQVLRVEVIRGAAVDLDVRTEGIVVNIVLKESLSADVGTWEGRVVHYADGQVKPGGQFSYSGESGDFDYILSLSATPRNGFLDRVDLLSLPGESPFLREEEEQTTNRTDLVGTVSLRYTFGDGDRFNLNGRYADEGRRETIQSLQFALTPDNKTFTGTFFNLRDVAKTNWEIGGDYEHRFASGDMFKTLFLFNSSTERDERTFSFISPTDQEKITRLQLQAPDREELILRGSYKFVLTPQHSLDVEVEGAINKLDQLVQLFTVDNGMSDELSLFNPDAKVDEKRTETFTKYTWQPTASLQFEGALDTEYSRLRQRGRDVNRTRSFFYVRPRLDVRYDYTDLIQIRGRFERTISQLEFANFVSGFNTDDSTNDVIKAGNPSLVPQKAWEYDLTIERRLADDQGVWALRLYYFDIEDHIHKIPVGDGTVAATGNIGSAKEAGAELSTGLRLGWLGMPGGSVDASYTIRETSTTDAFTLQNRSIDRLMDRFWSVSFRNDTSWNNLSYGISTAASGSKNISSPLFFFDVDYEDRIKIGSDISGFVGVKVLGSMTIRFDVKRVFNTNATRDRLTFVGNRGSGIVRLEEFRKGSFSRELKLSLRGSF
jgi:outer membrane receptor for ferrienterochelin and colicins